MDVYELSKCAMLKELCVKYLEELLKNVADENEYRKLFDKRLIFDAERKKINMILNENERYRIKSRLRTELIEIIDDTLESMFDVTDVPVNDITVVDDLLSSFPNIYRDNFILHINTEIASYEVDMFTTETKVKCCGGHINRIICVRPYKKTKIPKIKDRNINYSVQIAISLSKDAIADRHLFEEICKVIICPWCIRDGKKEIFAKLIDLENSFRSHHGFREMSHSRFTENHIETTVDEIRCDIETMVNEILYESILELCDLFQDFSEICGESEKNLNMMVVGDKDNVKQKREVRRR